MFYKKLTICQLINIILIVLCISACAWLMAALCTADFGSVAQGQPEYLYKGSSLAFVLGSMNHTSRAQPKALVAAVDVLGLPEGRPSLIMGEGGLGSIALTLAL